MQTRRWIDQSQPQTLVNAVILSYFSAAFGLLSFFDLLRFASLIGMLRVAVYAAVLVGLVASGYGIANEKRAAWYLGIVLVGAELLATLLGFLRIDSGPLSILAINLGGLGIFALLFTVARLVLLIHDQSRDYVRIWFK